MLATLDDLFRRTEVMLGDGVLRAEARGVRRGVDGEVAGDFVVRPGVPIRDGKSVDDGEGVLRDEARMLSAVVPARGEAFPVWDVGEGLDESS